jgi:hypothetical protein
MRTDYHAADSSSIICDVAVVFDRPAVIRVVLWCRLYVYPGGQGVADPQAVSIPPHAAFHGADVLLFGARLRGAEFMFRAEVVLRR